MKFTIEHAPSNPTLEYADSIIPPDGTTEIESIGGGSTIDVGKWVARKYKLPHTAIPTTAGTGSEVTPYVVLTENGKKITHEDWRFIPQSYILDPKRVVSLPEEHTIASGLDAYSQALEALWSKRKTNESSSYAIIAAHLIEKNLRRCIREPDDEEARINMLIAANLSGRAISITKTNVCHAISYPITELYGVPHGMACAASLGFFIDWFIKGKFPFRDLVKIPPIDVDKIADIAIQSPKLQDCPQTVTRRDIVSSLKGVSMV
jgi:alcohol dehydrogenase class IV